MSLSHSPRILSLIASSTEIICALGLRDYLVGRSHECDYPHSVLSLPACSEAKFNIEGSSRDIDQRVKNVLQDALSVYRIDVEMLQKLQPTLIVTQDHCQVCAVSLKDVEEASCSFLASRPTIVSLKPDTIEDILEGFYQIADAVGERHRVQRLVLEMREKMNAIRNEMQSLSVSYRPRVAMLEWVDPLWTSGGWIPELIDIAGGTDAWSKKGERAREVSFKELEQSDADIIIVAPCGYDIPRIMEEIDVLTRHPRWRELKAVKNNQVYVVDGNQYFNRPGPRIVDTIEILTEIIHPHRAADFYKEKAWISLRA